MNLGYQWEFPIKNIELNLEISKEEKETQELIKWVDENALKCGQKGKLKSLEIVKRLQKFQELKHLLNK